MAAIVDVDLAGDRLRPAHLALATEAPGPPAESAPTAKKNPVA